MKWTPLADGKSPGTESMSRTSLGDDSFRTWTSAKGQFSLDAKLVSFANGKVTLERRDGKEVKVEIERLSESDKDFVERWRSLER